MAGFFFTALLSAQTITPTTISLRAGGTQMFSSSISNCLWSTPIGSVNLAGYYQAPLAIPFAIATSVTCAAGGQSVTATVNLQASSIAVAGLQYIRGGNFAGALIVLSVTPPLVASNGTFFLNIDPQTLQTIPDPAHAGLQELSAGVNVLVEGNPIARRGAINFRAGTATGWVCADNPTLLAVDCAPSVNGVVFPSFGQVQNNLVYCESSNGTTQYTCSLGGAGQLLKTYKRGQVFMLMVDSTCVSSCSLDIDNLGIVSIKQNDGMTDPAGQLQANVPRWVFYNGTVFLLI